MVATALLQFVLFAIHNYGRDLLVHEDQDGSEQGGKDGNYRRPPGVLLGEWRNEPAPGAQRGLQLVGNLQFLGGHTQRIVEETHGENCDQHGEIANVLANDRGEEKGVLELLQNGGNEEGAGAENHRHKEYVFGGRAAAVSTNQGAIVGLQNLN